MTRLMTFLFAASIVVCCSEKKEIKNPVGTWQNTTQWDNNLITLTVLPDSMMLFKAEKSFCPGTKFFVSVGKWHLEQDSFLVMDQYADGRTFDLGRIFPELVQTQRDSSNVISLQVSAKLIFTGDEIYDVLPNGKRAPDRKYKRIDEKK